MGSKNKNPKKKNKKEEEPKSEGGATDAVQDSGRHRYKNVITDSRFASVHSDPRFAKLPKHKAKVAIDSRFDRMFTDKSFSSSSARIDKRGKPKKDSSQTSLKHYYRLEEEEEEQKSKKLKDEDVESDEESEESEREEGLKKGDKELSNLKLESEPEDDDESDDEASDDQSSTDTTDSDEEDEISSAEEDDLLQEEYVPEIDKETRRLAAVNLDWGHVKASDLYVLLSSFLPKGGHILSVAVYPSEFGLKRMEEEAVRGPVVLFDDDKEHNESDVDDGEIDNKKLRAYELSRLRYYYAVVECDSIATADYLYKTCDGVEFERSSNKLDLRFIPDSMDFKHPPRDVATEAPAKYEGLDFQTRALQQSQIHLTWDEDEPQRARTLKRKFNADQLAELEFKEFLASDESETGEDENDDVVEGQPEKKHKKKDLYRALLQSGNLSDDDEDCQDMEVTFNTGLEDISKRIVEKKDKESETVWEARLRKSREKKKARRNNSKYSTDDENSDDQEPKEVMDDFFIEEPSVKGRKEGHGKSDRKGKNHEETGKEGEASLAELKLLLADDNGADAGVKGYNLKPKKVKGKRGKKEKVVPDEGKIPYVDYKDPRFSALFTSPLYALDPTDPQFKRSTTYARQLAQKQQTVPEERAKLPASDQLPSDDMKTGKNEYLRSDEPSSKKENYELSSLVRSIKMKSKQVQVPSNTIKISGKNGKL
ncbi:hypothetical protein Acr_00g0042220 [Actinidia rufa]|uniref:NUC153 domain-containing protein n=1 Tax=Actinidia rufa TaxID=165716 RepID=A0A7J0DJJ9_9ERIC|nr:hypothetical protein Acr_00g0042220 [Actinidia rufa]